MGILPRILDKPRVLIIDDDELIAVSLCRWLAAEGCLCDVASDSVRARELIRRHRYEIVVVDPYLTGGLAADLPEIRALQPEATLIVATGYATAALREAGRCREIELVDKPQPVHVIGQLILEMSLSKVGKGETR